MSVGTAAARRGDPSWSELSRGAQLRLLVAAWSLRVTQETAWRHLNAVEPRWWDRSDDWDVVVGTLIRAKIGGVE